MTPAGTIAGLLRSVSLPAVAVDLQAFDHNVATLRARVVRAGVTLRVASKSVRVPALINRALAADGYAGVLSFHPKEAAAIAASGIEAVLAYPAIGPESDALVAAAAAGQPVVAIVDSAETVVDLSDRAQKAGTIVPVWIDVDPSLRVAGAHLGVRRSPIRHPEQAVALADLVAGTPGVRLVGVMAYEAAVAGLPDHTPGSRLLDPVRRLVKSRSARAARSLRGQVVSALRAAGHTVSTVNGGGTGSVDSTSADPVVTEVTVGSGLLCPTQFDRYNGLDLMPAAFLGLRVTRCSDEGFATCHMGGFIASGAGPAKAPEVAWPPGVAPTSSEGWGEVQTPLTVPTGAALRPGDTVLARHSKAGELMEHVDEVILIEGGRIVGTAPTFRGLGVIGCG